MQYLWSLSTQPPFWMLKCLLHLCLYTVFYACIQHIFFSSSSLILHATALEMASVLQKLFTPLFSGPPEPPRNKVTVVGVGQVGMACAVSILLRVRQTLLSTLPRLTVSLLASPCRLMPRILLDWHRMTDLLASDLPVISLLSFLRFGDECFGHHMETSTGTFLNQTILSRCSEYDKMAPGRLAMLLY